MFWFQSLVIKRVGILLKFIRISTGIRLIPFGFHWNTRRVTKLNFLAFWESYTHKKGKTVSFLFCPPPYQLVPWTRNPAGEDLLLYHVSLIFFILLLLQCFTKLFLKCWGVEWVLECFSLLCAASGDGVNKWKTHKREKETWWLTAISDGDDVCGWNGISRQRRNDVMAHFLMRTDVASNRDVRKLTVNSSFNSTSLP